ncbi:nudC domain-containing protein 3 isoform X1 [Ahaetulla prasina]|uniref:nudC domain-containing protein 3 isoform X1 n=1 Tax=Ahaetulla prasina TaxID=499056 RepID=UPI002647D62F|nr:nudC domain-containing protein 3 isoform X1 [Ahaetulla prasina]
MERSGAMTDMYDQALLGVLQHVGNVQEFLNILFGFLYRKTDFYRLLMQPSDRLGFPPGVAKSMAVRAFKTFEHLARQDDEKRQQEIEGKLKKREADMVAAGERTKVPPAIEEIEITSAVEQDSGLESGKTAVAEEPVKAEETVEAQVADTTAELPVSVATPVESEQTEFPRKQEQFQANPDSYNGAVRENYTWSQDYSDLEIKVPVPKHILKGRQVSVDINSSSIHVSVVEGSGHRVLVEGALTHKINTENSVWSLEPGKCILKVVKGDQMTQGHCNRHKCESVAKYLNINHLVMGILQLWITDHYQEFNPDLLKGDSTFHPSEINLSKVGEYWWSAILEGEEQIDIDKINKERSMATVDEEEHAVLDRLSFDYHQKLQGKPQSHEMKVHEMLKKGWDAEGSPFRGQKFDPSMFNISPGNMHF